MLVGSFLLLFTLLYQPIIHCLALVIISSNEVLIRLTHILLKDPLR